MDPKKKSILDRIERFEEEISKGKEYLANGSHAQWSGFRPLFDAKLRDGEELPPHRDWVKNVFIPQAEKALNLAEKALERLTRAGKRKQQRRRRHT